MAYGIVGQSGGIITVDSSPGAGTTFRIFLPRADATSVEARSTPAAVVPGAPPFWWWMATTLCGVPPVASWREWGTP
jgi:hypothetical protein